MMFHLDDRQPYQEPQQAPDPMQIRVPFLQQPTPLGDAVRRLTQAFGAQPCTPCQRRQQELNRRVMLMPW